MSATASEHSRLANIEERHAGRRAGESTALAVHNLGIGDGRGQKHSKLCCWVYACASEAPLRLLLVSDDHPGSIAALEPGTEKRMLRVGLTGDLGSGKSTVAAMLAQRGAFILSSDEMAKAMMQPGHRIYTTIVERFGPAILAADNSLDRRKLAALAFDAAQPRVEELNAIVHPAVLQAQEEQIAALAENNRHAIVVVESALIFSTHYTSTGTTAGPSPSPGAWRKRFDRILLVTAPESEKIARFIERVAGGRNLSAEERSALETDARQRLGVQHSAGYTAECMVLHNDQDIGQLAQQVEAAWHELQELERVGPSSTAPPQP